MDQALPGSRAFVQHKADDGHITDAPARSPFENAGEGRGSRDRQRQEFQSDPS